MSKLNGKKRAVIKAHPASGKSPKITQAPREDGSIFFSFLRFDGQHKWSETQELPTQDVWEIGEKLKCFEQMQWKHLAADQQYHHSVPFYKLRKEAQEIAANMGIDDYEQIWSLRLTGKQRLWGVRDKGYFLAIWWDPDHCICPSIKS